MKRNIISALIGIVIGLPISVAAAEARPEPRELLPRPAAESYIIELPGMTDEEAQEVKDQDLQADLQLLACLIQAEAGTQDLTGKRLVADVVLNRVADPEFPDTIPGVIYQPGQFSVVSNGSLADAYYTVTEDCFKAVSMELSDQIDYSILYFTAGGYGCGDPAYKYGDHYFGR